LRFKRATTRRTLPTTDAAVAYNNESITKPNGMGNNGSLLFKYVRPTLGSNSAICGPRRNSSSFGRFHRVNGVPVMRSDTGLTSDRMDKIGHPDSKTLGATGPRKPRNQSSPAMGTLSDSDIRTPRPCETCHHPRPNGPSTSSGILVRSGGSGGNVTERIGDHNMHAQAIATFAMHPKMQQMNIRRTVRRTSPFAGSSMTIIIIAA
jgi:hypothetical protein